MNIDVIIFGTMGALVCTINYFASNKDDKFQLALAILDVVCVVSAIIRAICS